jgi:transcription factor TFIIIB component B''
MNCIIEKGGTLFRPVPKSRGQSTPVHNSSDDHTQRVSNPATGRNDSSMPPPSTIPVRSTPGSNESDHSTALNISPQVSPLAGRTLNFITPTKGSPVVMPGRRAPTPLIIGQSRQLPTLARSTPTPSTAINAIRTPTPSDNASDPSTSTPPIPGSSSAVPSGTTGRSGNEAGDMTPTHDADSNLIEKRGVDESNDEREGPSKPLKRLRRTRDEAQQNGEPSSKSKGTTKRKKKVSVDDPDSTTELKRKRRSSSSTSTRSRKPKEQTLPPYDPETPRTDLDPTTITMSNLCKDTGQGRVSSKATEVMQNHIAWKAANREKRARMVAIMEAKKYGRNLEEEEEAASRPVEATTDPQSAATPGNVFGMEDVREPATRETTTGEFDYSQAMSSSRYNVQVRIGPNGETIVDEESLFVDTNAEQDTEDYTHVEESDTTKFVNSATHSKKCGGSRWNAEETELFFDVSLVYLVKKITKAFSRRSLNLARTTN